ncbi:Protein C17G10.1, partial [Aphelenchoides avenae]
MTERAEPVQAAGAGAGRFRIQDAYTAEAFAAQVKDTLAGNTGNSLPFPHFALPDFLSDVKLIAELRAELAKSEWKRTENDLYSLSQTTDVSNFDATATPTLVEFRRFMHRDVRDWLHETTGLELNDRVAITGSDYRQTDVLLPHDDRLEGRVFAFILYLNEAWNDADGGLLDLYDTDAETNRPSTIAKSLSPTGNMFVFFQVRANSWHAVREVLGADKSRLSLNGWFHADHAPPAPAPAPEAPLQRIKPALDITLSDVQTWMNPEYIKPTEQRRIKRLFAAKSELSLSHFLNPEKYKDALEALKTAKFTEVGPPDRRRIGRLEESELAADNPIGTLLRLFRSEAMTLLLTQWTGLRLYNLKKESSPGASPPPEKRGRTEAEPGPSSGRSTTGHVNGIHFSASPQTLPRLESVEVVSFINRLQHGYYSMADDQLAADSEKNGFCLDVILFLTEREQWATKVGGFVSYIASNDTSEILRVAPAANSVAIVFREPEVLNFTKYVNCLSADDSYFMLNCSFFGISDEDNESESSLESDVPGEEGFEEDYPSEVEPEGEETDSEHGGGEEENVGAGGH